LIIDFHTHIFPAKIYKNREKYFADEPAFRLLYSSPKSRLADAETLIESMDENHVDKSVVFGFPWKSGEYFRMHNDYVIESVMKYPDRLTGFACFDPCNPEAENETARCIEAGLKGAGELAFYQSGIDNESLERLKPVMALCRKKNLPVMIHTNEPIGHKYPGKTPNTMIQIYNMIEAFPENKIVLAHWGGGIFLFRLLKKEVKSALKNVYFDTAASPFLYDSDIYSYAKSLAGADRILFGSDFPLLKPERYFKEIKSAGIDNEDVEKILGINAEILLNL
jgi:uncharacterized protein